MNKGNEPSEENCAKQMNDMSDRDQKDNSDEIIRNQETRTRRAWVDRALQGVRRRLESGQGLPEADGLPEAGEPAEQRPPLYVVPSRRQR